LALVGVSEAVQVRPVALNPYHFQNQVVLFCLPNAALGAAVRIVGRSSQASKAARFRATLVQLRPAWRRKRRPFPSCSITGFSSSRRATQGGHNRGENHMTTFDFALLINALAHVLNAFATFRNAPRRRKKRR